MTHAKCNFDTQKTSGRLGNIDNFQTNTFSNDRSKESLYDRSFDEYRLRIFIARCTNQTLIGSSKR